jgi:hypothetical protein
MKFGNYEIRTDSCNWILKVWIGTRDKQGRPTGRRRCENLYYPTLRDMAWRVADLEAKKLVEEVGMEIEELAKALGEKLTALEDEIRAECGGVKANVRRSSGSRLEGNRGRPRPSAANTDVGWIGYANGDFNQPDPARERIELVSPVRKQPGRARLLAHPSP